MAQRYGGSSSGGQNFGSVIKALFGKDDISGGPQIGPDGKIIPTPYQGNKGFLNRDSRAKAEDLNNAMMLQAYMQQLQTQGNLEAEKLRGSSQLDVEKERGNQQRLTQSEKAKLDEAIATGNHAKAIEILNKSSENTIKETRNADNSKLLTSSGIPMNDQNLAVYDQALSDPRISNALAKENMQANWIQSPEAQPAFNRGQTANALSPVFNNMKTGSFFTAPNNSTYVPNEQGTDFNQYEGAIVEQAPYLADPGFTSKATGQTFGQEYKSAPMVTPGGPVKKVNPELLEIMRKKKAEAANQPQTVEPPASNLYNSLNTFNLMPNNPYGY